MLADEAVVAVGPFGAESLITSASIFWPESELTSIIRSRRIIYWVLRLARLIEWVQCEVVQIRNPVEIGEDVCRIYVTSATSRKVEPPI
jgi:hypothetical protein